MELGTVLTLIIVAGVIWGGLLFFITRAIKYENIKQKYGEE